MKFYSYVITLSLLLLLASCSNDKEVENDKVVEVVANQEDVEDEVDQTDEEPIEVSVEFPEAAAEPNQIVQQSPGPKLAEALTAIEEGNDSATWDTLLEDFSGEGLTEEQIYNGLVHLFGTDYSESYIALANFKPDYGEYDLDRKEKTFKNIAIQVDSSGSMAGQVPGGMKMDLAKDAIRQYASGLPETSKVSLKVYGHKGTGDDSDKALSCGSIELVYESNTYNEATFTNSLNQFKPSGWTPLAASVQSAYDDLKVNAAENAENILFIVSDGIETCDGNPVEAAKELANSDLNVKVNIIGFNVDDAGQKQLKATAAAGGGTYYTVNSNVELTNTISELLSNARTTMEENFNKATIQTNINFYSIEVGDQIDELVDFFRDDNSQERELHLEAIYQLEIRELVTESVAESLRALVEERYEQLNGLLDTLRTKAYDKSKQRREEIFEQLDAS